jgi:uncharacterized lipoprotein YajG
MMKFSTTIGVALSLTAWSLSLPAHAGTSNSNETVQTVVITGNNNSVNQSSISVHNSDSRRNRGNPVTSTRTRQTVDIQGDDNRVDQRSETYSRKNRQRR